LFAIVNALRHVDVFNLTSVRYLLASLILAYRPGAAELLGMAVTVGAIAAANLVGRRLGRYRRH
jgi:hypothetical protein